MIKLSKGDKAPDFFGINQYDDQVSLADFKGRKLILYFYPKDNTPGCTAQACNLSENIEKLKNTGFEVLGISPDNQKSHLKFIEKYNLGFDLLVDESKSVCKLYGVWGIKKFMGREYEGVHRTTFIIDSEGTIEKIITKVDTKNHTDQIL